MAVRRIITWVGLAPWALSVALHAAAAGVSSGWSGATSGWPGVTSVASSAVTRPLIWIPLIGVVSYVMARAASRWCRGVEVRAAVVAVLVFLVSFALLAAVGMLEAGSTEGWGLVVWSGMTMYFVFLLLAAIFVSATTHAVNTHGDRA